MMNLKKTALAAFLIFVLWTLMDFVIHGLILAETYLRLVPLIRAPAEMKLAVVNLVMAVNVLCFVGIYTAWIGGKSPKRALSYAGVYGLASGVTMGLGTYAAIPIPQVLAWGWFLGYWLECIAAGGILAWLVKE